MKLYLKKFRHKIKGNLLDVIDERNLAKDLHYKKTFSLWGLNNHKNNKKIYNANASHIEKIIYEFPIKKKIDNFLEIGCGDGIDLRYLKKNFKVKNIYALEIGNNIYKLSKENYLKNVFFCRGNALNLIYKNNSFDLIYSYGVFHHTKDLKKCLKECKRVLKKDGQLIFYNYKYHKNMFKKFGIIIENILLNFFKNFNYDYVKIFCYLISLFVLIIFSYPSKILKLLGSNILYKKFPLWWGLTPNDIIFDLTDRLFSPVNIRMTKEQMKKTLLKIGFFKINIKETRDGLVIKVIK
jgi:SAM-dependent methyltransferase